MYQRLIILHLAALFGFHANLGHSDDSLLPETAKRWAALASDDVDVFLDGQTLWLRPRSKAIEDRKISIPRLAAPIRSIQWTGTVDEHVQFKPEPDHWVFTWQTDPPAADAAATIEVLFDRPPVLLSNCPIAEPAGDHSIMLHAYQARTFGEKLRYEPQWYKNTVGYWTVPTDHASWKLRIPEAGSYSVAVLQGCGKGQGGSDAAISLRREDHVHAKLDFQTIDTGHFQNFRWNPLGVVVIDQAGVFELRLDAERIANKALFDVRAIHLVRQATAEN